MSAGFKQILANTLFSLLVKISQNFSTLLLMLNKLKERWKVNVVDLVLIICTFAIGGTLCASVCKKIMDLLQIEKGNFVWLASYIILVTFLWPLSVLLISIPFGQFKFFRSYLLKMWARMTGSRKAAISIAIFASGAGTNAQKIMEKFSVFNNSKINGSQTAGKDIRIGMVVCNNPVAGVLKIAAEFKIKTLLIERGRFFKGDCYLSEFKNHNIDFIVLAGFLWKIPPEIIKAYPNKIINIHPALLPKYGGKGMYGQRVHEAVIAAGDKKSGITIHYVDELYDHGNIIFQATCDIYKDDTPELLAKKIHTLEHHHYPEVIEEIIRKG